VALSENIEASAMDLIRVVKQFGFEGVVAKRRYSCYEPGKRTGAWVKYKVNRGQEFVIGGYTPGNPLDALIVGYYEGERLFYAAKVRNGFIPNVRREGADAKTLNGCGREGDRTAFFVLSEGLSVKPPRVQLNL